MFEGVTQTSPRPRPWRWAAVALLATLELALVRALGLFAPPAPVPEHTVEVRLLAPRQAPGVSPRVVRAASRPARSDPARPGPRRAPAPRVQPRELSLAAPPPARAAEPPTAAGGGLKDGGPGGAAPAREDAGVGGGAGGGSPAAAAALTPARPADLVLVRAGLARKFVYPPEALRRRWVGRVVLAFTLHADGSLADLTLRTSSGHSVLDDAALEAARAAAPFDPPGVDVLVVVPVIFRLG